MSTHFTEQELRDAILAFNGKIRENKEVIELLESFRDKKIELLLKDYQVDIEKENPSE